MPVGRLISKYGPSVARAVENAPGGLTGFNGMGKTAKIAFGGYLGYKALEGFGGQVAPAAINNAMDVAFGDPNADNAVLGTDLTPSMLYMNSGLPGRSIARGKNVDRTGIGSPVVNVGSPLMGGALGAVARKYDW